MEETTKSDVRVLQNLELIFQSLISDCIIMTDWDNEIDRQRNKELLCQNILKSTTHIFNRIGCVTAQKQFQLEKSKQSPQTQQEQHQSRMSRSSRRTESTTGPSTPEGMSKQPCESNSPSPRLRDHSKRYSTHSSAINQSKSLYNNQKNIASYSHKNGDDKYVKKEHSSTEEYDPIGSESYRSDDESYDEFSVTGKKKHMQKRKDFKHQFSHRKEHMTNKYLGMSSPSCSNQHEDVNPMSILVQTQEEKKKVLKYFYENWDPSGRNKIDVIKAIVRLYNYSFSSLYGYITSHHKRREEAQKGNHHKRRLNKDYYLQKMSSNEKTSSNDKMYQQNEKQHQQMSTSTPQLQQMAQTMVKRSYLNSVLADSEHSQSDSRILLRNNSVMHQEEEEEEEDDHVGNANQTASPATFLFGKAPPLIPLQRQDQIPFMQNQVKQNDSEDLDYFQNFADAH